MGVYMLVYAGVALFFFLEAIEALRPRRFRPHVPYPGVAGPQNHPQGLRYYEDVVLRDLEAYRAAGPGAHGGRGGPRGAPPFLEAARRVAKEGHVPRGQAGDGSEPKTVAWHPTL